MENQEFNQEEVKEENQFPTLVATSINKPFWFLVKLKHNIEIVEDNYKRYTEAITLVQFETIEESNRYFQLLNDDKGFEFIILENYSKY